MICNKCGASITAGTVCPSCLHNNTDVAATSAQHKERKKSRAPKILRKIALVLVILIPVTIGAMLLTNLAYPRKTVEEYGKLQGLTYNYGSYTGGDWDFSIEKSTDGDAYLFTATGMNGVDMNVTKEVDASVLEDLQVLMEKEGFFARELNSYHDNFVMDGWGENFCASFDNGELSYSRYGGDATKNLAISNYLLELAGMPPDTEDS